MFIYDWKLSRYHRLLDFFLEKQTLSHNLNEIRILVTNIDYKKSLLLKKYKNVDIKFSAHDAFLE